MNIGLLVIDCFFGNSLSLKDKRRILLRLIERLRRNFNIAVCEVDYHDQWQRSKIAIVLINTEWRILQQNTGKIIEAIERDRQVNILGAEMERLR